LFNRDVWSHHGILRGRTNNAAEGFHSKLSKLINKKKLVFFRIFKYSQGDENVKRSGIAEINCWRSAKKKKEKVFRPGNKN
jgi:hypothetical protein